jgi:hypothetical protein
MAGIVIPGRERQVTEGKESGGKQGQKVGAVLGGIAGAFGGPQAAIAGAATGASLGGMVGDWVRPGVAAQVTDPGQQTAMAGGGGGAMNRRISEIENEPIRGLQIARANLDLIPQDARAQVEPQLNEALRIELEKARRGVA